MKLTEPLSPHDPCGRPGCGHHREWHMHFHRRSYCASPGCACEMWRPHSRVSAWLHRLLDSRTQLGG